MKTVTIITWGGKRTRYTDLQLQEFIDNSEMYKTADNVPKWIAIKFMAIEGLPFSKAYEHAISWVRYAIRSQTSITMNVRSDRKYRKARKAF